MGAQAVKITRNKGMTKAAVTGAMTIERVAELRQGLLKAFEPGKPVVVSVTGVTEVDLTGLQLLCSAHRTSSARGVGFELEGFEAGPVAAVAKLAGMLRHTGCAQDACGTCIWKKSER